jgi:hypothetical protein
MKKLGRERRELALYAKAMHEAMQNNAPFADARQDAFSVLVTGSQPSKALEQRLWSNIQLPPGYHTAFNSALKEMSEKIIREAERQCEIARGSDQRPEYITVAFDGSWEHRRNSRRCIVVVFCVETRKIVDFFVADTKHPESGSRYRSCPQNLEVMALERMIPRFFEMGVVGYCHDNDSKTRKLIKDMTPKDYPELEEHIDPGHATKSLEWKILKAKFIPEGVADSLRRWMRTLIRNDSMSPQEKVKAWKNTVNHYQGNHEECPFKHTKNTPNVIQDEEVAQKLTKFLETTAWIPKCCSGQFSTQLNESFNRTKLKYAAKDIKWGFSWKARMCCAILDRNADPGTCWKLDLYDTLGLPPLSPENRQQIWKIEQSRLKKKTDQLSDRALQFKQYQWKQRKIFKSTGNLDAVKDFAYRDSPFAKTFQGKVTEP